MMPDIDDENELPLPPPILTLPEHVVNRIAAGEVVVSPSAALKELLENSIDAGATSISVTVRGGGAKLMQVTDNGRGVPPDDLPLLCERHATSKLRTFDDLPEVSTFGFRGEALASVSHVARVSVLTKTREAKCAQSARYVDGSLVGSPSPAAGLDGTQLTVEDMFYNLPTRQRAMRSASEEYRAVVDVVSRYAIKYSDVAFTCRRIPDRGGAGGARASASGGLDVRTSAGASAETNIRAAFGSALSQELIDFEVSLPDCGMTAKAYATNPGFSMRKGVFVLFINGRLVNCGPLKRAVDLAYSAYLPKGGHAFMYLDVMMRASDIDVNVHPNKMEVRFLHEAQLVDAVVLELECKLKSDGKSRTFLAQALITDNGTLERPKLASEEPESKSQHTRTRLDGDKVNRIGLIDDGPCEGKEAFVNPEDDKAPSAIAGGDGVFVYDAGRDSDGEQISSKVTYVARPSRAKKRRRASASAIRNLIDDMAGGEGGRSEDDADESDAEMGEFSDFIDDNVDPKTLEDDEAGSNCSSPLLVNSPSSKRGNYRKARGQRSTSPSPVVMASPNRRDAEEGGNDEGSEQVPVMDLDDDSEDSELPHEPPLPKESARPPSSLKPPKISSKDKVRTNRLAPIGAMNAFVTRGEQPSVALDLRKRRQRRSGAPPLLSSVRELITDLRSNVHRGVAEILREHTFVGVASEKYALIQYQTKLLLVDMVPVITELMYRQILIRFADLDCMTIDQPALLAPFIALAVKDSGGDDQKVSTCVELLLDRAPLLDEYFSLCISGAGVEDARIAQVPVLFGGVFPDVASMPEFLLSLCDVDWTSEQACLKGIARALSLWMGGCWHSEEGARRLGASCEELSGEKDLKKTAAATDEQRSWLLKHVLFESLRFDFDPSSDIAAAIREVTSTQKLYRVFERC